MQTTSHLADGTQLQQALAEEVKGLKLRVGKIERALAALPAAEVFGRARARQADVNWLGRLREQYTAEVCRETLEANRQFPIVGE
jgi:hypothetical protein